MGELFEIIQREEHADRFKDWRPEEPPCLDGITDIELDFETTGLKWWAGDKPIGVGIYYGNRSQYLAWGHRGTSLQHDEAVIKRWFEREIRNKRITNAATKFEVHMARVFGIDLEAQGNRVSDVQHYAALLDDHRLEFNQASLCRDYLTDEEKVTVVDGITIDPSRMADYPPGLVAIRAEGDVRQVRKLREVMWPLLTAEDLHRVRDLEDRCIYPTALMEANGAPIDLEKLHRWIPEVQRKYEQLLWDIFRETGLRFNPDSGNDWTKLFSYLKLPIENWTAGGRPSFTAAVLKRYSHIPLVAKGIKAGKYADLLSKYLLKIAKTVGADGILRYALHQLRSDEGGTVSGRYSSSAFRINKEEIGVNIQQQLAVEKQIDSYGDEYLIRELYIPGSGKFFGADAEQIEYRLFADYAGNPKVLKAYQENPRLKFHNLIWDMLKPFKPDLLYKPLKNLNFARIYGAKIIKIALMMEFITENDASDLYNISRRKNGGYRQMLADPRLKEANKVLEIYDRELPEVNPLLQMAEHLAKPGCDEDCNAFNDLHQQGIEHRGHVKTKMGRRARFPDGQRLHSALNRVIQGSAADVNKLKIIDLHETRKETQFTMRGTVHDEIFGDVPDEEHGKKVAEILDQQALETKVPILWSAKVTSNWRECA